MFSPSAFPYPQLNVLLAMILSCLKHRLPKYKNFVPTYTYKFKIPTCYHRKKVKVENK